MDQWWQSLNTAGPQDTPKHTNTHTCTHTHTHTHTHMQAEVAVNFSSAFFPSRTVLPPVPQEQWAAFRRPGTKSSDPSFLVRDGRESVLFYGMFFCWGS